ncbi:hypothetical protein OUZ56_018561 [Daphnia magna]|uniref:Uncharacterized protein n=1 Tax=Daphnia magna TaxID=35525 RepID=A0ABQ9Z963_9CRUS|nr:hypothetical protein OUZ56_018561 [Daphnia magna]
MDQNKTSSEGDTLKSEQKSLNNDIDHLQKENNCLNRKLKMGITYDASSKTDASNFEKGTSTSKEATTDKKAW